MLREGDQAPSFFGRTHDGSEVRLEDYAGKQNVVLYFYPKDFTPVCTQEACMFRDAHEELAAADTVVIGVSLDDAVSHGRFTQEHRLNFVLLADSDRSISNAYGALGLLGGLLNLAKRVTFVIDKQGIVRRVFRSELSASKHLDEVRSVLRTLA